MLITDNIIAERAQKISMTKTQRKIADYFVKNLERVGMSSSMELAREIGVSDVSITRFARAIGYNGFTDLKNDIYNNLAITAAGGISSLSLTERYNANREMSGTNVCRTDYLKGSQYNLEKTFQQNSDEAFDKAVAVLLQANRWYIAGFRSCIGVASQCAYLLQMVKRNVVSVLNEGASGIAQIFDIAKDDCLLLFSVSRFYKIDIELAKLAKKRGASICVITDSMLSPLSEIADVMLLAESRSMAFFCSAVPLTAIAEYLVSKITQECSETYYQAAKQWDELTEELRIK